MKDLALRRHVHYLQPNSRSETIHQCVWYDCETTPHKGEDGVTKHVLEFGWAAYRRRTQRGEWTEPVWHRFTSGKELWTWITKLTRPKKTLYVWAHNHFFDYSASSGSVSLTTLGFTLMNAIVDSPPFVMTWRKSSSKLVLVDTLNIWRMSLAEMGKSTGCTKLSLPPSWTGVPEDDEYCRRDVEIIMKAVCDWADFLRDEDMGKFCLTVASQAMQTFRHRYLTDNILIDADKEALSVSRAAYRGGRVESFYIGRLAGPLYLLDVNSLYPYCMLSYEFPTKLVGVFPKPSNMEVIDLCEKYLCCAHVVLRTKKACIARKEQNKLVFPIGVFDAYVTTPELVYLFQEEEVISVEQVAVYEKSRPFVQFVTDLYQRKVSLTRNNNKVEAGHYKLLLNSFSGKWGQNGIKWTTVARSKRGGIAFWRSINYQTNEVVCYRLFDHLIQRSDTFPESSNSHPAIAAHITAYGRMVLWALMRQIPPKHCFYCDTDSVLVSEEGFKHVKQLEANEVLGALKVVGQYSEAVIYGCKDYTLDSVRTCKGIRDKAVELEPGRYRQEKWFGFRASLRKGFMDAPRMQEIVKRLRRVYDKGTVGPDGFVTPFHRS